MSEVIERVARALYVKEWGDIYKWEDNTTDQPYWCDQARAAIEALREPTPEMIDAGQRTECEHGEMNCGAAAAWRAMLSAALEQPK